MAAGGKPSIRYHWFPPELATLVVVKRKKKHNISFLNSSRALHNECFSLGGHCSSAFTRRPCASAFKTLFSLLSQSVLEYLSGSSGSNINSEDEPVIDNCNNLLVNSIGIESQEDNLLLCTSGQSDTPKLVLVNNGNCDLDLKAASCFHYSVSLHYQVQESVEQSSLFHPHSRGNARNWFWNYIPSIKSTLPLKSDKGHGCWGRVELPSCFTHGLCNLRSLCGHSEKLCHLRRLLIGQTSPIVDGTWEFQGASSSLDGRAGASDIKSENFIGRALNSISNAFRKDNLRGESTCNGTFEPLNVVVVEHCHDIADSNNAIGGIRDEKRSIALPKPSALLAPTKLHYCVKFSPLKFFPSGTAQGISDSYGFSQRSVSTVPSSSPGKECRVFGGEGNMDERMMEQGAGPVKSEETWRTDNSSQNATCRSPSPKMGNNALAGALAGAFVSLWLHPVDTVKTVIQAHSAGHRSVVHSFGSIVSERGIAGLYRGIGSNLASSAPISAIYTFTYESVKAALLPHLAKEYHAFAHCTAGGCASIATSFIFTPSECIKQQMQVGSQYLSSWKALTGILDKGGFPLLYAGWGAVLCRNVPQSVIKFYTYEGLKHLALRKHSTETRLSTLQTLAFGGLAGSTAALFTTPFDVIKTRLQTQIPGSPTYYDGVFHALQQIARQEGLGGLYRGLLPRLVIYVSQGALFFASYEFFKHVLAIEVRHLSIQTSQSRATNNMGQSAIAESA
eukprot:Gb_14414 [translate_table: standard]